MLAVAATGGCASLTDACDAFCQRYCELQRECNGTAPASCRSTCSANLVAPTSCAAVYRRIRGMTCAELSATPCGSYCADLCNAAVGCQAPADFAPLCMQGCTQAPATCYLDFAAGRDCESIGRESVCYYERAMGGVGSVVGCGLDVDGDVGKPCRDASDCLGGLGCVEVSAPATPPGKAGGRSVERVCAPCTTRADCSTGSRPVPYCGRDQRCHATCSEDMHCPESIPRCTDGVCRCATCRSCENDLDCAERDPRDTCETTFENVCRRRCNDSRQCPPGARCASGRCTDPIGTPCDEGSTYCGGLGECAEIDAHLQTVIDRYCTISCYDADECPSGYLCIDYTCLRL